MTRSLALLAFALALCFPLLAKQQDNPQVDLLFEEYQGANVPGASVAIIREGSVMYQKAYGLAEVEKKTPATTATNYRLASLSKQFTAMAILILIDRGKLSLDDSLTRIFPDFPSYGESITVRHLLGHTGGLRDYEDLIPSSQTKQVTDDDVLAMMKKQSSGVFLPGSHYKYSNGGYCVLGTIVAEVSGQSFAGFLKENIFGPLGMENTVAYESGISTVPNRAYGYSPSGSQFEQTDQSVTSATLGDGGVYTSVAEYFLWDQALNASSLLSPALQELAFTPGTLNDGSKTQYGFGWVLDTYRGLKRQSHTGSTVGFRTGVSRFPEKKFTVIVVVNRANATPWDTAKKIADLFLFL